MLHQKIHEKKSKIPEKRNDGGEQAGELHEDYGMKCCPDESIFLGVIVNSTMSTTSSHIQEKRSIFKI